jgi:4a-hydroxytetrahydrobiopterin dehydratase
MSKLEQAAIDQQLAEMPEWAQTGETLQQTYKFKTFKDAMAFVNGVAAMAEEQQHHPDIMVRYNKVTLTLSTHDAGGITMKDFALAQACDRLAQGRPAKSTAGKRIR